MAQEGFKRKLTAIFSADAVGYSRLMAEDETATVKTIASYREIMASLIKQHRGRVVDSPGDNLLAEFSSVVDAVQCAVAVQNEFQTRNAELTENRRMEFRIGINLGDVIDEKDRIYGDGVNVAARLETLADPGGICVSKTAFDQIETKLPLGYEYLGKQSVKNIPKPVGAYRVLMQPRVIVAKQKEEAKGIPFWRSKAVLTVGIAVLLVIVGVAVWNFYLRPAPAEVASVEKMSYALPDKPSIAVLPLTNMSGDPEQEYFSDGLTEEIITALSKVHNMFVIARNSTFTYKGKSVRISQVAEELGVQYVLEGSVRKAGDQVRITAQLIDALTGHHLWAERYDRDLKDIFTLQDEITKEIITALQVKLTMGEDARLLGKGTDNLEVYLKCLRARELIARSTIEGNVLARQLSEEAIALDPEYPEAYRMLGVTHFVDVLHGVSKSPEESLALASKLTRKAIDLDESNGVAHAKLGFILVMMRQYDKAIEEGKRALELEPNSAYVLHTYGAILYFAARNEEAIPLFEKAIRLNPKPPNMYRHHYGAALREAERYEEAIAQVKKAIEREPNDILSYSVLASSYSMAGREEEARAAAAEILRINPNFSLENYIKRSPHKDQTVNERYVDAMRKAGLK
jgi:adenylate cyclase